MPFGSKEHTWSIDIDTGKNQNRHQNGTGAKSIFEDYRISLTGT